MKAIWYSKAAPTSDEVEKIKTQLGFDLIECSAFNQIKPNFTSLSEAGEIARKMLATAREAGAVAVCGEFPVPLLAVLWSMAQSTMATYGDMWPNPIPLFSPDGEKWFEVGAI